MNITYKNQKLKEMCESDGHKSELVKKYGKDVAAKLKKRLDQIGAFNSLDDIPVTPPFRRHKLKGNRSDEFAVNIDKEYRLIFTIDEIYTKSSNLKEVKSIEIKEVSKHYE